MAKETILDKKFNIRWNLVFYDLVMYAVVCSFVSYVYGRMTNHSMTMAWVYAGVAFASVTLFRFWLKCYQMVIRYGGVQIYLRLLLADFLGVMSYFPLKFMLGLPLNSQRWLILLLLNLLGALSMRLIYRYCYRYGSRRGPKGCLLRGVLSIFVGEKFLTEQYDKEKISKIRVAIMGAGRLGAVLADELLSNDSASYRPVCFIDMDSKKQGREIMGLPIFPEGAEGLDALKENGVQQIVFAITELPDEKKELLTKLYSQEGYHVKVYDFPMADVEKNGKRTLRDFDVEELLFRKQIIVNNQLTRDYYRNKVVLITGGGGSIGSELCRQLAKMEPKQIIILDIYENGVYDVQQELRIAYKDTLNLQVEICSITNKQALERVFETYKPHIVINAAAHKHVPLMEHNVIEAVENNVFGALNVVECCEKYGVERMMTVSTDKAVNPTNIMGATKRMCELIELAHSQSGTKTTFSATRFGNVLGSAGSVIPLFKRQIAHGGPITITDKRIIRYFMTIPEASQLVLQSGAMAKNGELFVLDMGQPVKILDLAENMIRLSGFKPYKEIDIIETGLRPGEKLYEELLVQSDTLTKTDNDLIFIEKDEPISMTELNERLAWLQEAMATNDEELTRKAMHRAVPTFKTPEEVNGEVK